MTIVFWRMKFPFVWYDACLLYPIGALCAVYEKKLYSQEKLRRCILLLGILGICIGYIGEMILWNWGQKSNFGSLILVLFTNISAISLCISIYYFCCFYSLKSSFWYKIGRSSYYIYLYQGLCIIISKVIIPKNHNIQIFVIIIMLYCIIKMRNQIDRRQY